MPAEIIEGGEGAAAHAVDVQRAVEVIDLVLQDARVPASRFDLLGLSAVVKAIHPHAVRPVHHCGEAGHAQAALEEFGTLIAERGNLGIDDHVEGNGPAFALGQVFGGGVL